MAEREFRKLCEFEWASAANYIMYISDKIGLQEVDMQGVVNFPLTKMGPEKLVRKKERVLATLLCNKSKLECFAGDSDNNLGEDELAVLRTIYLQYRGSINTVMGHISLAKKYMVPDDDLFSSRVEEGDDDLF